MSGRYSDSPLNWFSCYRFRELVDRDGIDQQAIAEKAELTKSAVNNAYKHALGLGLGAVGPLAKYFGFKTRGAFLDAVDVWWESEGRDFAVATRDAEKREERARLLGAPGLARTSDPVTRRKRAAVSKAQKLFQSPSDAKARRRGSRAEK